MQELIFAKTPLSPNPMEKYVGLRNFRLSTKTVGNKCKGKYLAKKSVTVTNTRLPPRWTGKIVVLQLWLNLPHKSFKLCGSEGWTYGLPCYVFSWPGTLAALYHFRILTFVFICPFVFCMLWVIPELILHPVVELLWVLLPLSMELAANGSVLEFLSNSIWRQNICKKVEKCESDANQCNPDYHQQALVAAGRDLSPIPVSWADWGGE